MSELDKKLEQILELAQSYIDDGNVQRRARDVAIPATKQAFVDSGWMKLDKLDELEAKLIKAMENLDKNIRAEHKCTTGQEWYDKFEKELNKLEGNYHKWVGPLPGEILEAAKKASVIE